MTALNFGRFRIPQAPENNPSSINVAPFLELGTSGNQPIITEPAAL